MSRTYRIGHWVPIGPPAGMNCTAPLHDPKSSCGSGPAVPIMQLDGIEYDGSAACKRHAGRRLWSAAERLRS